MSLFSSFQLLKAARALALAAVVAVGFSGPLIAAEHGEDDPLTREELLAAVLDGGPTVQIALQALFYELRGDGEAIVALAIDLIDLLRDRDEADVVALAATLIVDAAFEALDTQIIAQLSIDDTTVTQFKQNIVLDVDVPDGLYRMILYTDDQGKTVVVNQEVTVTTDQTGESPDGVTVIIVKVVNGKIEFDIEAVAGFEIVLSEIVLEPVDEPDDLDFQAELMDEVASLFGDIAAAAGDIEPAAEVTDAVSPS